ncbi:MAG: DNA-binding protein [Clostridiales bacterium]|nr:DNA-binding protein [Clostridiales bacterium]
MNDKNSAFRMTMLYDFYGELLTERQQEFYDLYHNEDFSLAEIAENAGITRQGVRDVIVRAEAILNEMEEKTGIVARFLEVREGLNAIRQSAEQIEALNRTRFRSQQLEQLAKEIQERAAEMQK